VNGSKTAAEIADKLKIQKTAIRSHLEPLRAEQAITSYFKVEGPGRPRKVYENNRKWTGAVPKKI
jgi:DeoR family transcriptional regulator, suf operon transcriptional repressor